MTGDVDALLTELYDGALWGEPEQARPFLRALGEATRSCTVAFVRGEFAQAKPDLVLTIGADSSRSERGHVGAGHWFRPFWTKLHEGGLYNGDDPGQQVMPSSRHDDQAADPDENLQSLVVCIAQSQQRGAFLQLHRSPASGAYDRSSLCVLRRVTPHLINVHRLRMHFRSLQVQAAQPTLHHHGMFLLDSQWRWVGGNEVADRMVADGWWRGKRSAPLDANHAVTRAKWKTLQQEAGLDCARHRVIPVRNTEGTLVALANLHAYGAETEGETVPRYLLFVRPLQAPDGEAVEGELRQLFGLTAAESALAMALRRQIDTAHASAALGIAESSARTRLQSIFEKTNTHCRSELMLLIAALADTVV